MSIKLTKNEQKKQKDALKQYERYLPTLQLKKQQLQAVIRGVQVEEEKLRTERHAKEFALTSWISLFGENPSFEKGGIESLVCPEEIKCSVGNIAGVKVPLFESITFKDVEYNPEDYPLWVDRGIEAVKEIVILRAKSTVLSRELDALSKELRSTSQRVNLFEKVKIPETKENIKKISVALGDASVSAVVRGKIAKKKLSKQEVAK